MTAHQYMSPGYPALYDNNIDEITLVTLTDSSRIGFRIEIINYHLENRHVDGSCHDYFMIEPIAAKNGYDVSSLITGTNNIASSYLNNQICGEMGVITTNGILSAAPLVFEVQNLESFNIIFHSDYSIGAGGYIMNIYELCGSGNYGDNCEFFDDPLTNQQNVGTSIGSYSSDNYPYNYEDNQDQTILVQTSNTDSQFGVQIEILDFQLEDNSSGCYDYLIIEPLSTKNGDDVSLLENYRLFTSQGTVSLFNNEICGEMRYWSDEGTFIRKQVFKILNLESFNIRFYSDSSNVERGWKIDVYEFDSSQTASNSIPVSSHPISTYRTEQPDLSLILADDSESVSKLHNSKNLEPGVISE